MKRIPIIIFALLAGGMAMGRDFVAPAQPTSTAASTSTSRVVQRQPRQQIDGAAARVVKARRPLQMVSPFAPKELGTGAELVYHEQNDQMEHPGGVKKARPLGITLFSFSF